MLKIFKVDDGEYWWIAANSEAEAREYAIKDYSVDESEIEEITEIPSDYQLSIYVSDDPEDSKLPIKPTKDDEGRWFCTATAEQWVQNRQAGDMICSSLF